MADIKHLLHIYAPISTIYEAITTEKGLQNWWTTDTSGETREGAYLDFRFGSKGFIQMKIQKLNPEIFVQWECTDAAPEWRGTHVTFDLVQKPENVMLRFTHSGWTELSDFYANCNFSWGRYLDSLRKYCETGQGEPFRT